jgi:hypothetical protein
MPPRLETVEDAIRAIASLPETMQGRVHWRLAATMLRRAAVAAVDVELARSMFERALEYEGWMMCRLASASSLDTEMAANPRAEGPHCRLA